MNLPLQSSIKYGIKFEGPQERFGESLLAFKDPDGLLLELVGTSQEQEHPPWGGSTVPAEYAVRGVHTVTLCEDGYELTAKLLSDLGFDFQQQEGNIFRYKIGEGGSGKQVDVRCAPDFWKGAIAVGTVHHVAWRVRNDDEHQAWREAIADLGYNVTPVLDRQYFHSIYFPEPGGIIFELATDAPGFTINESVEELGTHLMLPQWLETKRVYIEKTLPPLYLPQSNTPVGATSYPEVELEFEHIFIPATAEQPTLLLLHGTGGDETDLLSLGQELAPGAAMLSPRGKVLENGMPRFFRRSAEGVFDLEDLKFRTDELADFVTAAAAAYSFDLNRAIAVGYSNGANIATSMLLHRSEVLGAAILFRPMEPIAPQPLPDLTGIPIFIAAGRSDSIIRPEDTQRLVKLLQDAGSDVTLHWQDGGHALSEEDVQAARKWIVDSG